MVEPVRYFSHVNEVQYREAIDGALTVDQFHPKLNPLSLSHVHVQGVHSPTQRGDP